jgi:hypothetical protein
MDAAVEGILLEIVDAKHREYGVYLEALAQVETMAAHCPEGAGILQQLESVASVLNPGGLQNEMPMGNKASQ